MVQEKRILVEGFYGGDWLESFMIGTTSILPYGVKRLELSGNNLDLDMSKLKIDLNHREQNLKYLSLKYKPPLQLELL